MGSKTAARELAIACDVPIIPGSEGILTLTLTLTLTLILNLALTLDLALTLTLISQVLRESSLSSLTLRNLLTNSVSL